MEVIFIKDLRGQGKKGDIKNVSDGYAKNYLIKNGYAVLKTKEELVRLEKANANKLAEDKANKEKAKELKNKLDEVTIEFKVKTGEYDKVFGSISVKQIKEELNKLGYKIDKNQIMLEVPISVLGFHKVEVELYSNIKANIKVHLIKE
jgi:ribosomal protein L9